VTHVAAAASVVALLLNGHVVAADPATGAVVTGPQIGATTRYVGDLLARSRDGRTVYALTAHAVVALDAPTLAVTRRYALPPRTTFRAIAVGQRTGRLYLAGNTPSAAVGAVLAPASGRYLAQTTLRGGGDWLVLGISVADDERSLYVSYHGSSTTGADRVAVRGRGLARCRDRTPPRIACLSEHGNVRAWRGSVVATTGEGPLLVLSPAGAALARIQLGLPGNHVMQLAISPDGSEAAVIGSCGYAGGLSLVDLATRTRRVFGRIDREICGERVAYSGNSVLVARNALPVPQGTPSAITVVDRATGRVTRSIPVPTDVLELLP
jgi:hypothetical protein